MMTFVGRRCLAQVVTNDCCGSRECAAALFQRRWHVVIAFAEGVLAVLQRALGCVDTESEHQRDFGGLLSGAGYVAGEPADFHFRAPCNKRGRGNSQT